MKDPFEITLENSPKRLPEWLHIKPPKGTAFLSTLQTVQGCHTICQEGRCPNRLECFEKKCATFLICGPYCTRSCAFCSVKFSPHPPPPDEDEPERIAQAVKALSLQHTVITMSSRDDLEDKGCSHLLKTINCVKEKNPKTSIEILTSDFDGKIASWQLLKENKTYQIFNHNLETVESMSKKIRCKACYTQSLALLAFMKKDNPALLTKSGIMVGLGETYNEVQETLKNLKNCGCDIVTIGQYLQSDKKKMAPKEFVRPEIFQEYKQFAEELNITFVFSAPFVRSSYNAEQVLKR